ncbi:MAG: right-handed parallel beta-helix repeat-containing protein, partial [Phycisphaerae bacterium]|nr:right-handed parallel beta-helix repeat-containing protein [Phycisphaerae bacterium]
MLSVTLGPDGWTTFGPSSDTQIWYVSSSSGDDNNPGTQAAPFRTLAKAKSMMRDNRPDWLLLKRGDTFNEVFGSWTRSGRSPEEMMLIGAYGTGPRPIVRTNGLDADGITLAGGSTIPIRYLAIQGIEFIDNTHDGTEDKYGIRLQRTGSHFYIEDVKVSNFKDGIVIGMEPPNPGVSNVTVRRSVIVDNWQKKTSGHSQGLYASGTTNGLLIEENVFDRNGWKEGVPGAEKTVYNHNMYINDGARNVVIRNNISTRASLRGILTRGGGVVSGNVTARNAIGIETWGNAIIDNNIVLENGDVPDFPQGFGIQVVENNGNAVITNNIIAHDRSSYTYNVFGIRVWHSLSGATVTDNIVYNWRRPFWMKNDTNLNMIVERNQFQIDDTFHGVLVHSGPVPANQNFDYENNIYYSPRTQPFYYSGAFRNLTQYRQDLEDNTSLFF